jgi:hypothetical protein
MSINAMNKLEKITRTTALFPLPLGEAQGKGR